MTTLVCVLSKAVEYIVLENISLALSVFLGTVNHTAFLRMGNLIFTKWINRQLIFILATFTPKNRRIFSLIALVF